jgi:SAM-dependent methyltransferase
VTTVAEDARTDLIARTLQISPALWREVLAAFRAQVPQPRPTEDVDEELARCLPPFARAFRSRSPHEAVVPAGVDEGVGPVGCPACGRGAVRAVVARAPGPLVYGACDGCGHGLLLSGGVARSPYGGAGYYERRDQEGVGYDGYADDAAYREAKGAALIARLRTATGAVARLLEVGSGFGFTRVAAERAGLTTAGVDLNPAAVAACRQRTGMPTFTGTLAEALVAPASGIAPGTWDTVLYQFVLEHVADPLAELTAARRALRPGGWLMLLVPNMATFEVDVFGGAYRSLRADHLHLPTRGSLEAMFARTGFALRQLDSHCNLDLLRGLVSQAALARLHQTGRGPDLFVLARSVA